NAVKFTPKGGKIQVRLERVNSHVEIIVADNGQGIASEELSSVFERFWQSEKPGEGNHGVGLGLSIVKEIVNLHGGNITADSQGLGHGATFTVRLPLPVTATASLEPRRHPTGTHPASRDNSSRFDGVSILVIDDDADTCEALRNLLTSLGANVRSATSGREA